MSHTLGPDNNSLITVAAVKSNSEGVTVQLGGVSLDMMLDSELAVSLVRKDVISSQMIDVEKIPLETCHSSRR